jgi:hypothetical protein
MSHADRIIGMILLNCSPAAGPGNSWFSVRTIRISHILQIKITVVPGGLELYKKSSCNVRSQSKKSYIKKNYLLETLF